MSTLYFTVFLQFSTELGKATSSVGSCRAPAGRLPEIWGKLPGLCGKLPVAVCRAFCLACLGQGGVKGLIAGDATDCWLQKSAPWGHTN